jgi:hypothetical protein
MTILLTIWQPHGPTCANMKEKATLQIKIMFHKAIVYPARARLGRNDVCLTHHGKEYTGTYPYTKNAERMDSSSGTPTGIPTRVSICKIL